MRTLCRRATALFCCLMVAAAASLTGGCGQTGPLFLPPADQSSGDNSESAARR